VLFFVSVGMLVNPAYLAANWTHVLGACVLIVVVKGLVSALITFALPYPARTALILGAGRGQIGEFSFIVGQAGLGLSLITPDQYSLILAGAIVSITANPLMFRLIDPAERWLKQYPSLWRFLDRHGPPQPVKVEALSGHVVVVGSGRVGRHISEVLTQLKVPRLVVEVDPTRLALLHRLGVPVLYGDAASSEVLDHANLEHARALIITLPDDAAARMIVNLARSKSPELRIIVRASTWDGARRLSEAGANHVVRPELEGGIEIVRRTLLDLELPVDHVLQYVELIRQEELAEADQLSAAREQLLLGLQGAKKQN
jgi:CPA2 family monovalent cation:H+ antiporter-2